MSEIDTVIAEAIRTKIEAGIVDALGGEAQIISQIVAAALNQKVDRRASDGYRTEKVAWIRDLVDGLVRDETRKAATAFMEDHRAEIQAEIKKRFKTDGAALAKTICDSVFGNIRPNLRLDVNTWKED